MEMHQIRYFLAVSETLNLTKAAERCHVPQPSLTRAIKALEMELGGELIHRERNLSHFTEIGQRVLPLLRQCYDMSISAKSVAASMRSGDVVPFEKISCAEDTSNPVCTKRQHAAPITRDQIVGVAKQVSAGSAERSITTVLRPTVTQACVHPITTHSSAVRFMVGFMSAIGRSLVPNKNKQETAYGILRSRIEESQYAPSQRLVIDSLARELGISQMPIREAIRRLEAEGMVLYTANSGPVVAPASREQWFELMEVLAVLEGYATAAAAAHIGPNDIKALRKINNAMREALSELDLQKWSEMNRKLHQLIHSLCRNRALVDEIVRTIQRCDSISRVAFARERGVVIHILGIKTGEETIAKHEEIITALDSKAPASRIERITRHHVLQPVKQVKRSLERGISSESPSEFDFLL